MNYLQFLDVTLAVTGAGNHHSPEELVFMINRKGGELSRCLKRFRQYESVDGSFFDKGNPVKLFQDRKVVFK